MLNHVVLGKFIPERIILNPDLILNQTRKL